MERSTDSNGTKRGRGRPRAGIGESERMAPEILVNTVNVDAAQLEQEAATVAAQAAADAAQVAADLPPTPEQEAAAVQVENAAEGYKMIALAFVAQGAELFCPAWEVTAGEKTDMADAIVQALLLWFPDGLMPPKYMALIVIAGVGVRIAGARYDDVTGLRPRHVAKPTPAQPQPAPNGQYFTN